LLGKWHLGGLRMKERAMRDKVPGPHEHGFDDYLCQIEEQPLRGQFFKDENIYRKGGQCMLRNEQQLTAEDPYYNMYYTDIMGEESIRLINDYQKTDKPFFMELCFMAPHMPYEPAPEPHWSATAANGISEKQHRIRSMIARMDYQIGRITAELDKLGIADNTVVLFTSDNGGHKESNNGPFRGHKSELYEGGIRVPFIMRWPGKVPASKITTELGHTNDILPTLCATAGIALPENANYDGRNIFPALQGQSMNNADKAHFWYFNKFAGKKKKKTMMTGVVREGDWKLLFSYGEMKELYNLKEDPQESKNKLS
jgi:arylsulfatase A